MNYILGIDIGTGSTKAVAVDYTGKAFHTEQVSYPLIVPQEDYREQDPEVIWQAFIKVITLSVQQHKAWPAAIALSSAMHSLLLVDEHGKPLTRMITWADNRSADIAAALKNSSEGEMLYRQTGTPVHAMSPLCKIAWFAQQQPDLFAAAHKFISIKEYIWHNLFGVYEVDHSIASATGLFDILTLTWSPQALRFASITSELLSTPVDTSYTRTGVTTAVSLQWGLSEPVPFLIGASDGCCANLGSFAVEPGVAALTIGTSGAIRVASKHPVYNFGAMTFNYRLKEDTFICGGPINNGGIALKWYIQNLLGKELKTAADYDAILHSIDSIPAGAAGLVFLPYLLGERAPLWSSDACGTFFGMHADHRQEHFTKALLEGITMSLYHISQCIEESGLAIQQVNVSGGFVKSEAWVQLLADVFGKPIGLLGSEDASAIGAAFLALVKLNIVDSVRQLLPETTKIYIPNTDKHAIYRNMIFPLFRNLTHTLALNMSVLADLKKEAL